ncbi:MAG: VCBS repeat-containing protein, partial [Actinomycetota bacterium]|nr:VCBS repeat-containing protein [Actinomycetota bacterium]
MASATAVAASAILIAVPAQGAREKGPDGQPRPIKAPSLPTLPDVPSKWRKGKITPLSIPGAASVARGTWLTWPPGSKRRTGVEVRLPAAAGTPLMGDWNGDGMLTPGRYEAGQWFITNAAVNSAQWEGYAAFGGEPTDVPVVGFLDGDKRSDIGVFRNGTWTWQVTKGDTPAPVVFGQAGDVPVVGDWNGDGRSDIGFVRQGRWNLRITGLERKPRGLDKSITVQWAKREGTAVLSFVFGSFGDLPVVGDWNRDGSDDPGVIQDRSTWVLSRGIDKLRPTEKQSHALLADEVPIVGSQATGPGHCPTATRDGERFGKALAAQVRPARTPAGTRKIDGNQEILGTVQDGLRYVITKDLTNRLYSRTSQAYYDALSTHRTIEESVRRSANAALAGAVALTTSPWKNVNGISRAELRDYVRWQVRSLACEHGALTPGGWGNTWQSALWATTLGQAAWMIWDDLTPNEQALVAAMVYSEAEYASARGPRYHRNRLGQDLTPGDSQADEVSWDLLAPALAMAMMPGNKQMPNWRNSLISMAISAFARPGDLHKVQEFNGVRPDIRLPGTNANEDGTVTNHGIVNPDYVQNVQHLWWAASLLRSGGQPVPEALFMNADIIYRALAVVDYPSPPYAAPGGTVYQPGGQ